MTSVAWLPEKVTITLSSEHPVRTVSIDLNGIYVGAHGELRSAQVLALRALMGPFTFPPGAIQDLRKRWGIALDYDPSEDCALISFSDLPCDDSDACDVTVELTRTGEVARIIIEGRFRSPRADANSRHP